MKSRKLYWTAMFAMCAIAGAIFVGCDQTPRAATNQMDSKSNADIGSASKEDSEHGHEAGQHGGTIVALGRDSYHIEAVVDQTGVIRLYTLGKDESRVIDVESQTLSGFVKSTGDTEAQSVAFEPQPQPGDAEKRTSLFVGKIPAALVGRRLDVTIPSIRIDGERFRLGFQSGQEDHGDDVKMPNKTAGNEESAVFLTAAGRYTADDIAANGNMTPSQKFKGIKSSHDMKPKPGDRLCPITATKANPKFPWVVDGKTFEFCCPPCIDEFVKSAKEASEPLPGPETYVKN